jgi:hypothetical protein
MSLSPVGLGSVSAWTSRDGAMSGDSDGLFDLLAAAAALHMAGAGQQLDLAVIAPKPLDDQPGASMMPTPLHAAAVHPGAANADAAAPMADVEAGPELPQSSQHDDAATAHAKADDASFVRHGTLPVIVSGQLIELALLRDRRTARDSGPTRRLSMVLESATPGPVTVEARVVDDCLVIGFSGGYSTAAPAIRNEYTEEVETLARRFGWKFTHTVWETAR